MIAQQQALTPGGHPRLRDRCCECCGHPLPAPEPDEVLVYGDLRLDVPRGILLVGGKAAKWDYRRTAPLDILAVLLRPPGSVWRRDRLMTYLGMWDVQPHTLTVHTYQIRLALRPSACVRLVTIRGSYGDGGCDTRYMLALAQ